MTGDRTRNRSVLPPADVPDSFARTGHTGAMAANITYGADIADETELKLCGDVSGAKRAVELGISPWFNSIAFAKAGGKAIAVDPDAERIAEMRRRADDAEVTVQCLAADLADLGDIASASCEVVVAAQTILDVEDLGRLLRQVHRILKPSTPFVIAMPHPFASVEASKPYGTVARTIGGWFTALERSNFRVDQGQGARRRTDAADPHDTRAPRTERRQLTDLLTRPAARPAARSGQRPGHVGAWHRRDDVGVRKGGCLIRTGRRRRPGRRACSQAPVD